MRIPLEWLAAFFEGGALDPSEVASRLVESGLECTIETGPNVPDGVITARLVTCEKHPSADRLSVCTVDAGDGRSRTIVCGAPNARAGAIGVLALPGADLGGGLVIAPRAMRGVVSEGMLCSAKELGLSSDGVGILLLPDSTPIGKPLASVLSGGPVLVTEPASNRGDWLSIEGVARELAAVTRRSRRGVAPPSTSALPPGAWSVAVEDPADCPRYAARLVDGLTPGPSPSWMAARLEAAGIRPISNLVDVTNYVLLELGHPLHAFDLDRLATPPIGVRLARAGEKLVTLDGKERALDPSILVIADASGPVARAGLMGGEPTRVTEGTRRILLEGAAFHAARVRRGARALRMTTDASHRFERGVDPEGVGRALDRAVELIVQIVPGARAIGALDAYPAPPSPARVVLTRRNLRRILGEELGAAEPRELLERLDFVVEEETEAGWTVIVPTFRRDVAAEEDLIEEVGRVAGYDRFEERTRVRTAGAPVGAPRIERLARSRRLLLSAGLTEVVCPALVDGARGERVLVEDSFFSTGVALRNPLSQDRDRLRGSIVPGLIEVLAANRAQSATDLAVFEVGTVFRALPGGGVDERIRAAVLLAGAGLGRPWIAASKPCDFFDMKGILEVYVEQFGGSSLRLEAASFPPLTADRSARVLLDGREIGRLGDLGTGPRKTFDLPEDLPVFWAELDLESMGRDAARARVFQSLPRFPGAVRDLAFVVSRALLQEELETCLAAAGGERLASIRLFDVYEGPPLAEDEKSLAYTLVFRSPERSLPTEEVDRLVEDVVARAKERAGARLR